jgi:ribose transport system ATP-binding protein
VPFDLRAGEVHVLFGENGAGKSTLISIVAGALRPESGTIKLRGEPVELGSVHHARSLGISAVFQEFSLVPQLTVEQNLFLGSETSHGGLLDKRALHAQAEEILDRLGFPLRPSQRVADLSRAEQQMVEIAKAFRSLCTVLILDEPTSSLTERETDRLFALIEQAKEQGVGIIYITHRMSEIRRVGDRITVLRDGRYVDTVDAKDATDTQLLELMTGRVIEQIFPKIRFDPGKVLLDVQDLTLATGTASKVSIEVRAGEVVGVAGLVGSGKSEVARACFGLEPIASGRVAFGGEETTGLKPRAMLDRGLFYNPPDRRAEGLVMQRSVRENVALPSLYLERFSGPLFLRRGSERALAGDIAGKLNLQPRSIERAVDHFSGGNQQKVLLGKGLTREVKLFVFDEPTVGVDVGTRVAIYDFIRELCEAGAGVLLVSSDLPEVLHLTNRVYVMYRGQLRAELKGDEITEARVLDHFFEREAA